MAPWFCSVNNGAMLMYFRGSCIVGAHVLSGLMYCRGSCIVGAHVLSGLMYCRVDYWGRPQVETGLSIREGANDTGAPTDLSHNTFQRVIGPQLDPVAIGESIIGQGFLAVLFQQLRKLFPASSDARSAITDCIFLSRCLWILLGVDRLQHPGDVPRALPEKEPSIKAKCERFCTLVEAL